MSEKKTEPSVVEEAWRAFGKVRRGFYAELGTWPVTPTLPMEALPSLLAERFPFVVPRKAAALVEEVGELLRDGTVHVTHPRYFGLFNPSVRPVSVIADALAALYNPQLAAWSHAPAANEIERHTLAYLLCKLGLDPVRGGGCFTTGGAEANHSAVLLALARACPKWRSSGLRALPASPRIYVSEEAHHSFDKIVVQAGLGEESLRKVPVDSLLRMIPQALLDAIERDRAAGDLPLMVVGTAGTTGAGVLDLLPDLAAIAAAQGLWFHVDAAFGGYACLSADLAGCLTGIEGADSITWDAHKGLSVPMGAGMFFCREREAMARTFGLRTGYMPAGSEGALDPYASTIQWSRRCIGLKVFMALAELGEDGTRAQVEHQFAMGLTLRRRLADAGWRIVNETPLPVVCFVRPSWTAEDPAVDALVASLQKRGAVWISKVQLTHHGWALRACITSYHTQEHDLETLIQELEAVCAATTRGIGPGG